MMMQPVTGGQKEPINKIYLRTTLLKNSPPRVSVCLRRRARRSQSHFCENFLVFSLFFQKKIVPGKRGGRCLEKGTWGGCCLEMDSSVNLNNAYRRGKVSERYFTPLPGHHFTHRLPCPTQQQGVTVTRAPRDIYYKPLKTFEKFIREKEHRVT